MKYYRDRGLNGIHRYWAVRPSAAGGGVDIIESERHDRSPLNSEPFCAVTKTGRRSFRPRDVTEISEMRFMLELTKALQYLAGQVRREVKNEWARSSTSIR